MLLQKPETIELNFIHQIIQNIQNIFSIKNDEKFIKYKNFIRISYELVIRGTRVFGGPVDNLFYTKFTDLRNKAVDNCRIIYSKDTSKTE